MRCYMVDEISRPDMEKIDAFLRENAHGSGLENLFWIEMPESRLSETQSRHPECKPYNFAVELGENWVKAEFFVRTSTSLRCSCSSYSDPDQRNFIFNFMEGMIEDLGIRT